MALPPNAGEPLPDPRSDPRDYVLDFSSTQPNPSAGAPAQPPRPAETASAKTPPAPSRTAHLSIHFKCCNVYAPIYKTADGQAYAGHCPKCAKPVRIKVGPGGSTSRIFTAE